MLLAPALLLWVYLGSLGALAAGDLSGIYGRIARAPHVIDPPRFIAAHLRRLGLLFALALQSLL